MTAPHRPANSSKNSALGRESRNDGLEPAWGVTIEVPLEQSISAGAERLLSTVIRARDAAVERCRETRDDACHRDPPSPAMSSDAGVVRSAQPAEQLGVHVAG